MLVFDELKKNDPQLRLEDLTTDPFTGKPLGYRRKGDDYDLYSAGGYDHDENGARVPGTRIPITLPR